jgi:hypothetical protein
MLESARRLPFDFADSTTLTTCAELGLWMPRVIETVRFNDRKTELNPTRLCRAKGRKDFGFYFGAIPCQYRARSHHAAGAVAYRIGESEISARGVARHRFGGVEDETTNARLADLSPMISANR